MTQKDPQPMDAASHYLAGLGYFKGDKVAQDDKKAYQHWRKAAESGHAASLSNLGILYELGRGVPQNSKIAFSYFQNAAGKGDVHGKLNAGKCYLAGRGVKKDIAQAELLITEAAEAGNAEAQQLLSAVNENEANTLSPQRKWAVLAIIVGTLFWAYCYTSYLAPVLIHALGMDSAQRVHVAFWLVPILLPPLLLLGLVLRNNSK